MKILIVDDFEKVRSLIKKMLTQHLSDCICFESSDGDDAIQQNKKIKPDLILMDIMMGKTDGLVACKKIKEDSPLTQIIIISQLPEEEYRLIALNAGASEYLNKENLYQLPYLINKFIDLK